MVLDIRQAREDELPALWQFYGEVCAAQETAPCSPGWTFGIYPDREELAAHIAAGEVMLGVDEGRVRASAVLTGRDDPMYADAKWLTEAEPEEVAVVHLLALHPDARGQGLSHMFLDALLATAKARGKRLVRLDVVKGNFIAEALYVRHGFRFVEERTVIYEDTGEICVRLFEVVLA